MSRTRSRWRRILLLFSLLVFAVCAVGGWKSHQLHAAKEIFRRQGFHVMHRNHYPKSDWLTNLQYDDAVCEYTWPEFDVYVESRSEPFDFEPPFLRPQRADFYKCNVAGSLFLRDFAESISFKSSNLNLAAARAILEAKPSGEIHLRRCEPIDTIIESAFKTQRQLQRPVRIILDVPVENRVRAVKHATSTLLIAELPRGLRRTYDRREIKDARFDESVLTCSEWCNNGITVLLDFEPTSDGRAKFPEMPLHFSIDLQLSQERLNLVVQIHGWIDRSELQ